MIMGWVFLHPSLGDVVAVASQGCFSFLTPQPGRCCRRCLAGAFFFRILAPKGHNCSKKVISGPEFLKNDDIWLDFIKLDLL